MAFSGLTITLEGANKIFSCANVTIEKNSLGFYESKGEIQAQKATLTELCQTLVAHLHAFNR